MSAYQRAPQEDYPPPGYGSPYPPPPPPAHPPAPAPPYEGYPPPVYSGYPPPRPPQRPQYEGYQGYFNDQYPPPPPPSQPYQHHHHHHETDCGSVLRGWKVRIRTPINVASETEFQPQWDKNPYTQFVTPRPNNPSCCTVLL